MNIIRYNSPEIAAWTPFNRLSPLREFLDSALQLSGSGATRGWAPRLDLYENADQVTVKVELAGMKKEDFDLSLEDDTLTISGQRKAETASGESFRSERFFGAFSRAVTLPAAVQADKVKATYQDGILTVVLPKAEEAKPKKIEVHLN